jgi:FtsP/CotA-like multicopper oxidase with cupredoxin domain
VQYNAPYNFGFPIGGVYFLVNGQFQPVATLQPGEYQRWRMVNAAHQSSLSLSIPGCTTWLIAMDGVYLRSPRLKNTSFPLVLPPGARGDFAVSCPQPGVFFLRSNENPDVFNFGGQEGFNTGVLALLNVTGPTMSMQAPTTMPSLPAYLADLRPATVQPGATRNVSWDIIRLINNTNGLTDVPIYGISGQAYNASSPSSGCVSMAQGVQEWTIVNPIWICNASVKHCLTTMDRNAASGAMLKEYQEPVTLSHGFHLHTFKYQVVADSNGGVSKDYEVGDWRDTVTTPMAGWVNLRWQPATFQGVVLGHCHMLTHAGRVISLTKA